MTTEKNNRPKSRWCDQCKCRHDINHPHFKDAKTDRAADTITGSTSAADLANKADQNRPNTNNSKLATERLKQQVEAEQREGLERRWSRRMRLIYGVWAKILDDKTLRLTEQEEKDFGQVHADFAVAWGITASNKLEASLDVLTMHGTSIAARSKWVQEALAALHSKGEDAELPAMPDNHAAENAQPIRRN